MDPFIQQQLMNGTYTRPTANWSYSHMLMPKRTFQRTLGFWFVVATINGFFGGFAVNELGQLLGWWH